MDPASEEDVYFVEKHLDDMSKSVYEYIDVLKMGIQKGMVRTQKECTAGINAMKAEHPRITQNGPIGEYCRLTVSVLVKESLGLSNLR